MQTKRFFRYLAPNLVSSASLTFGMLSIMSTVHGRWADAAWFVIFSVLTDKLDGFVARLVKGTSEFGVQLDSFADFLNFGIAPATLFYTYLSRPESPLAQGTEHGLLMASMALWVLAVTFRLARYNIVGDDPRCKRIFFGVPTTLMGGLLCAIFLVFLKYGADPSGTPILEYDEPNLLGNLRLGSDVWRIWPSLTTVGALLMASALKIPKLGISKSKALTVFIFLNVVAGYATGATRHFPEFLGFDAAMWILISVVWGQLNREVKQLRPPPLFPRVDRPMSQLPLRPEEDAVPDEEEESSEHEGHDPHTAPTR
jgi:CDP-diacylglycerol---serine O-phosphatidyltransferase